MSNKSAFSPLLSFGSGTRIPPNRRTQRSRGDEFKRVYTRLMWVAASRSGRHGNTESTRAESHHHSESG